MPRAKTDSKSTRDHTRGQKPKHIPKGKAHAKPRSIRPHSKKYPRGTAMELAQETGYSVTWVGRMLQLGKTPDQIRAEKRAPAAPDPSSPDETETFYAAQAREKRAIASRRELELAQMRGELMEVEPARLWFAGIVIKARDVLLAIGPDLKDRLAQETDPIKCEALVTSQVERALGILADYGKLDARKVWAKSHGDRYLKSADEELATISKRQKQKKRKTKTK